MIDKVDNAEWVDTEKPMFHVVKKYRIKPANIKKYIIVGFDGDESHHTHGVWIHKVETCRADEEMV